MRLRGPRLLLVAGVISACGGDAGADATTPAPDTAIEAATDAASDTGAATVAATDPVTGIVPEGFDLVGATVTNADGTVCELCVWLAETPAQRARGLMGVTDLGAADAMAFAFEEPSQGTFWMRDTSLALSIVFFAADGSFVSTTDMVPCPVDVADEACPRYRAAGAYLTAIELPAGDAARLGIGAGSRLELADGPGCADG